MTKTGNGSSNDEGELQGRPLFIGTLKILIIRLMNKLLQPERPCIGTGKGSGNGRGPGNGNTVRQAAFAGWRNGRGGERNVPVAGNFGYDPQGQYQITARDADGNGEADHFVNNIGDGQYRDPWNGNVGDLNTLPIQTDNPTRGFNYGN
jgi:hypothetical protein